MPVQLGPRGEALIKSYETLRLSAHLPTPDDVPTIGWGHTKGVRLGMTCTPDQAQNWFLADTADAVREVSRACSTCPVKLTPSAIDALISLVFNVGGGAVAPSSTIGKALAKGDVFGVWAGFVLWRKQGKKDLQGLARRRSAEMVLFMEDRLI